MTILFIDATCPKPYTKELIESGKSGCGGTEATLIRVSHGLMASGHTVLIEQAGRTEDDDIYRSHTTGSPDVVVVLRRPEAVALARTRFPKAKLFFWMHDWCGDDLITCYPELVSARATIVCVSNMHKAQVQMTLAPSCDLSLVPIKVIYPPISDALRPTGMQYDKNKMVFFSSPHKGLSHAVKIFFQLRKNFLPDIKLYVSNPGYYEPTLREMDGLVDLGVLPHAEAMKHVEESLCFFYPNHVFPETFGLVFTEANALGTPVLTHRCGSSSEVLSDARQFINARDNKDVIDKVVHWYNGGRPQVSCQDKYRLTPIVSEWMKLFSA